MGVYIVLLRGINVGGKNLVPMAKLKEFLADQGFSDCKTLLQSGNAVAKGPDRAPSELEAALEKEAEVSLGVKCQFLVRMPEELERVIKDNPFSDFAQKDPSHLLVHFGKEPWNASELASIQEENGGPEELKAVGREAFVTYPESIGESRLARNRRWTKLGSSSSARNWNTVLKLQAMAKELS